LALDRERQPLGCDLRLPLLRTPPGPSGWRGDPQRRLVGGHRLRAEHGVLQRDQGRGDRPVRDPLCRARRRQHPRDRPLPRVLQNQPHGDYASCGAAVSHHGGSRLREFDHERR
jgi:hypothetical protein